MVPQLRAVLLDEIGVASRLAHDTARRCLVISHAMHGRGADQSSTRRGWSQASEHVVLKETIGVRLG